MADQFALLEGRKNEAVTLFASGARTVSQKSDDQENVYHSGVQIFVDVTAVTATPSIEVTIEGLDETTGLYYELERTAAITAVDQTLLRLEPGSTEVANQVKAAFLPRVWRVQVLHADADNITYSIGANLTGNA